MRNIAKYFSIFDRSPIMTSLIQNYLKSFSMVDNDNSLFQALQRENEGMPKLNETLKRTVAKLVK